MDIFREKYAQKLLEEPEVIDYLRKEQLDKIRRVDTNLKPKAKTTHHTMKENTSSDFSFRTTTYVRSHLNPIKANSAQTFNTASSYSRSKTANPDKKAKMITTDAKWNFVFKRKSKHNTSTFSGFNASGFLDQSLISHDSPNKRSPSISPIPSPRAPEKKKFKVAGSGVSILNFKIRRQLDRPPLRVPLNSSVDLTYDPKEYEDDAEFKRKSGTITPVEPTLNEKASIPLFSIQEETYVEDSGKRQLTMSMFVTQDPL